MIIKNGKTVEIFYSNPRRRIILSQDEYAELEYSIKNPPPKVTIKNPLKMWSPCIGKECKHSSHKKNA